MFKLSKALALAGATMTLACTAAAQTTPDGFVEVPGGKLWYETCGSGAKTMVLIHDGVLHSVGWDDVWPGLCKTFRVVRYDRRGYGRSPEAKAPYSPVEDLAAVMKAAGMERAVIVGASAGGGLAIDFTLAHPRQVDRLVVIGPEVSGVAHTGYMAARTIELQTRLARGDLEGALKGSWVLARGDDANVQRLLDLEKASPQDMKHKDPATPAPPAAPRLSEIKVPTLVLIGEDDVADNQAEAGIVEYAVKGATRMVIAKAGHLLYMEQPARFVDIVSRFVDPTGAGPVPGAEAALRRTIEEMRQGAPDYSRMGPLMAAVIRPQVDATKRLIKGMGAVKSVTFTGGDPGGDDTFEVVFDKAKTHWRIKMGEGGRTEMLMLKP